ncbi:hypothetical protein Aca07nite_64500 [Actinoplanes capillaceus]|uniref:Uncharacterized protein n=1 Tax=Actinoplanes campanulatus TaxID=113559 RepID=A0ABQ3WSF0_9ACTN|nr:hypothetical protein [Actinoplanes capillaceus]GID49175.1 hypothetical protein Aca07nite_64500 [Actinoplanes capillaceus]
MVPSFYSATGAAGWLIMLLAWVALIAMAVWGIKRLFPDRNQTTAPTSPQHHQSENLGPPPTTPGRR